MATRVRQGPYCSHKPLETAGCCKPRGQAMLDLLPADSKGSNKRSMQGRKQIWASKQSSLDLLLKDWEFKGAFLKMHNQNKVKVWWIPECPPLRSHSTKTSIHQPTGKSREEQTREKNKIHIILACPWGAGWVHCARQESQAVHNKPMKQRPPASSEPSKAHTQHQPHASTRPMEAVPKEHLWKKRILSTTTGTWRHSNMNFCSQRCPKPNLTLPSKQSPDKSPGTEQPVLFPSLHPGGRRPSKYKISGAPQIPENSIPSPILSTTPFSADSITFSLLYYALAVCPLFFRATLPLHSQSWHLPCWHLHLQHLWHTCIQTTTILPFSVLIDFWATHFWDVWYHWIILFSNLFVSLFMFWIDSFFRRVSKKDAATVVIWLSQQLT